MPVADPVTWTDAVRRTLSRYDEVLLRQVAGQLVRPRGHWPADDLLERSLATLANAAVIDRRLRDLHPGPRRLLALIAHSRQPCWPLGSVVELAVALGHADGLEAVQALLDAGLAYPVLPAEGTGRLKSFEQWLGTAGGPGPSVFADPCVTARALGEDLGLPPCPGAVAEARSVHESDGLEWPLRLAIVWQGLSTAPFRRTQQGGLFKRDYDRLTQDPVLGKPPAESLAELPDPALLTLALAQAEGVAQESQGELVAGGLPAVWEEGLPATLLSLWAALPTLTDWTPVGVRREGIGNPYPAACLLAMLLLTRLPEASWARPSALEEWVLQHHPFWAGVPGNKPWPPGSTGIAAFLLGLAHPLRLVQAARDADDEYVVRLSPLGRWVLGLGELPAAPPAFVQTLLVQPNLEVVVYRQGLTPSLIARLSRFATWKALGAACTLQLQPERVYRGMESGLTFEEIQRTLDQHGMRPTPTAVIESLRTWANKRERITVYPAAALFEFASADDLTEALARGLPAVRLSERLAVVSSEAGVDFRHFRLSGTRDYALPPERCVEVEPDGVTLAVDVARSDLLLETELQRFAEPLDGVGVTGRRRYRLTPASLAAGRGTGLNANVLDAWFRQRTGSSLSAAARLLLTGADAPPVAVRRQLVLHVASEELADGLQQWPQTRSLVGERLGATTLAIAEDDLPELRQRLEALGVRVEEA